MTYVKATSILPEELIKEIQKYVQGESIYIPKPETAYLKWGARSGGRQFVLDRNAAIKDAFANGQSIVQLAEQHHLSLETIKKIVYTK